MLEPVIRIENVGKRYMISHRGTGGNNTLRDAITDGVRSFGRRMFPSNRDIAPKTKKEEFWALQDVSLKIERGQVVGIIGRNGAGKSTLLKVLSRITEPTTGRIAIRGRVASLLEVGTGFHSELTGRENIFFNGSVLGMRKAEIKRKFDEIVTFSGVEKFLDTPVKRYSSGMYVRLAFAVAAHLDPDILIIDEVLAVGDAAFQRKCLDRIGDISSREGRTILFVSHNMASIQSLCEKAFLLDNGRLILEGTAQDVVKNYLRSTASMDYDSLDKRHDRSGDGSVRFTTISIEGINPEKAIYPGSSLKITLGYCGKADILNPYFCISVYNSDSNSCLFRLATDRRNGFPDFLPPEGKVTCVTEPINITQSRCYVNLTVGRGLVEADYIMRAAFFDVEEESFQKTGSMQSIGKTFTTIINKWTIGSGD